MNAARRSDPAGAPTTPFVRSRVAGRGCLAASTASAAVDVAGKSPGRRDKLAKARNGAAVSSIGRPGQSRDWSGTEPGHFIDGTDIHSLKISVARACPVVSWCRLGSRGTWARRGSPAPTSPARLLRRLARRSGVSQGCRLASGAPDLHVKRRLSVSLRQSWAAMCGVAPD